MKKTGRNLGKENLSEKPVRDHLVEVDLLKGCAIIAVILIHVLSAPLLWVIGAPYHIWQAVPVFLLLAAFNGALSYKWLNATTLNQSYNSAVLVRRFKRLLLPFIGICIVQMVLILWLLPSSLLPDLHYYQLLQSGIYGIITFLIGGAAGPGNYFIPLILFQILILPLFYWLAVRYSPDKMLVFSLIFDVVLQYVVFIAGIPSTIAGVYYLNYLFLPALGIWFALKVHKQPAIIVIAGLLSAAYITAVFYFQFQIWFISPSSGFFTEFSFFWTLVLVLCGFRYFPTASPLKSLAVIAELGKASWHIFLAQMTIFYFSWKWIQITILNPIQMLIPRSVDFLVIPVGAILMITICCLAGYAWYVAGKYLTKYGMDMHKKAT